MENGNMRQYIQRNLDADRLRLLREVASGAYKTWYGVDGLY